MSLDNSSRISFIEYYFSWFSSVEALYFICIGYLKNQFPANGDTFFCPLGSGQTPLRVNLISFEAGWVFN
jgi:hypothetical protein